VLYLQRGCGKDKSAVILFGEERDRAVRFKSNANFYFAVKTYGYVPKPELILYEDEEWRVKREPGEFPSFYGVWAWWGVGQSPVVIQHKHGEKWETASQFVCTIKERSEIYHGLNDWEQATYWKENGHWRKECRICEKPFPEKVMNLFHFFKAIIENE
jgi:hypothetical protein